MARRVDLNEGWRLAACPDSGEEACADTFAGLPDLAGVSVSFPSSIEGALTRAGQLPDYKTGGNARLCEWTEHRIWVAQRSFILSAEPMDARSEKYYIFIRELWGSAGVWVNGQKAAASGACGSLCADITGLIREEEENSIALVFRPDAREAKRLFAVYGGFFAPRILCTGIGGAIYVKGVSYASILSLDAVANPAGVDVRACIEAQNRGKYTFKYRVARGAQLAGSVNAAQSLLACTQEISQRVQTDGDADGCDAHLVLERGGVRCDFLETAVRREPPLPANIRAVQWAPLSMHICDLKRGDYEGALGLLRGMGANAVYVRGCVRERALFYETCARLGMPVIREDGADGALRDARFVPAKGDPDRFAQAIFEARKEGGAIVLQNMASACEEADAGALLSCKLQPTRQYGAAMEALAGEAVYLKKVDSIRYDVWLFSDAPPGMALVEFALVDAAGKQIFWKVWHIAQDGAFAPTGEFDALPPSGALAVAAQAAVFKNGKQVCCHRRMLREGTKDSKLRVVRERGAWHLLNDSPGFAKSVLVRAGGLLLKPCLFTVFPWAKQPFSACQECMPEDFEILAGKEG